MPLDRRSFAAIFILLAAFTSPSQSLVPFRQTKSCQNLTQQEYKPRVPHQILGEAFLHRYEEVSIIGDVHGCFDELKALLDNHKLGNPNVLKILTGDLARKGPKSKQLVQYVRTTPHIITVRGNNDLHVLTMRGLPRDQLSKSDQFIRDLSQEDLAWMEQLPYSLTLPSLDTLVVHGGLLPGLLLDQVEPYTIMNVRNLMVDKDCPGGYKPDKGFTMGEMAWGSVWNGPQHVIFGHDSERQLQFHPKATGVDSGCVYGSNLTALFVVGPRAGTLVQHPCPAYADH